MNIPTCATIYHTFDKSTWTGVPLDEPDKAHWVDPTTGFDCLIVRNRGGALCGYVGVHTGHPAHGVAYGDLDFYADVHGGLTFADGCGHSPDPSVGICHVVPDGEPDDVWWLGFDCAHLGDRSPAYEALPNNPFSPFDGTYRDFDYVVSEVTALAAQLVVAPPAQLEGPTA